MRIVLSFSRSVARTLSLAVLSIVSLAAAHAQANPPLILRSPSLSQSSIAFRYAGDIWTVPRSGGEATRLTSAGRVEAGPYFSPNGEEIAYTAHFDGGDDVYVLSAQGGLPRRVTFHPEGSIVVGWSPDGKSLLVSASYTSPRHFNRLFSIKADGSGMPVELPLYQAFQGNYSPDGTSLAYEPVSRWEDAWKVYYGGQNYPIWVVNLKTLDLVKIPSDNTSDFNPVWVGHSIYFLSNRTEGSTPFGKRGPQSLYHYDTRTQAVSVAQKNSGLDLKSIQSGPGGLVYEQFGSIHLLDLTDGGDKVGADHTVNISIHGALANLLPHTVSISPREIISSAISPTGQRAAFEAHGDIFTVPAEKGDVRNLTQTPGAAERQPSWSPDGKTIAYFSDESGEYQLYLRDPNGLSKPTLINLGSETSYFSRPRWSPDSKHLNFTDKHQRLWYVDVPTKDEKGNLKPAGTPVLIYQGHSSQFDDAGIKASWSPDSNWIAFVHPAENGLTAVYLYNLTTKVTTQVTDAMSAADSPAFDPNGQYLYFLASTDQGVSTNGIDIGSLDRAVTAGVYVAVLAKDTASPIPPESDDEKAKDDAKPADSKSDNKTDNKADQKPDAAKADAKPADGKDAPKDGAKDAKAETKIDLDGIGNRILAMPIDPRNYSNIFVPKSGNIYITEDSPFGRPSAERDFPSNLWRYTTDKRKSELILPGIDFITFSADGSKFLAAQHGSWSIGATDDLHPDATPGKPINTGDMTATIDLRAEWRQEFYETWRIEREFLWDPGTHGISIPKIEARYKPWLDGLASRAEFSELSTEMLGEINIGHMFISGPRNPDPAPKTGLLGATYSTANDRFRFNKIYVGQDWTPGTTSPLTVPGLNVHSGDYLLAVNGRELHAGDNLYSFFVGTAGKQTVLHIGPSADGKDARDITVTPVDSEDDLRYLDWVESNRHKVDELSGGKVAYVYMPNTGGPGYNSFNRYFYAQLNKKALVLDERGNEGGFIADYIVEVLNRKPLSVFINRDGTPVIDPVGAIFGPKAMLINQNSGSGGDAMPWYFRKNNLGKLIGTRTWGGLVAIGGFPRLIDGGAVTAPHTALYGLTGEFEVENHGIAPDIDVDVTPKDFASGHDSQLEAGVKNVLDELAAHPLPTYPPLPHPNYHQHDGIGKP